MKNILLLFVLLFSSLIAFGQSPKRLQAADKIPKEFTTASADKYRKKIDELERSPAKGRNARKAKRDKKEFYLQSSFVIDDVLQSGVILFNDPISKYVTQVLEKLPLSTALKKAKPRVYLLNSNEVNAFATEQGIIFISVGLLANLENEAQLAFILGHELSHVEHKHSIDKFLQKKDVSKRDYEKNMKSIAIDKSLFKEALYSRKLEEEADEDGLALFLKSKYDPAAIDGVFQVLHYSYLPYADIAFNNSFFEDDNFIFPSAYTLKEVNPIQPMIVDEKEEEKSTHPASAKRKAKLIDAITSEKSEGKSVYLVGEDAFKNVQSIARYQLPFLALENGDFGRAIYNAYLQLKEYPNDLELKKVIGKSLYMESKIRNDKNMGESATRRYYKYVEEMEGAAQSMDNLLKQMDDKELNILALKYNYELLQANKTDEELPEIVADLFIEISSHQKNFDGYSNSAPPKILEEDKPEEPTNEDADSRKNKIEKANKKSNEYWQYAYVGYVNSEEFKKGAKAGLKTFKEREDDTVDVQLARKYQAQRRKERTKGKSLGIKKIVVVNPFYLSLDERKDNSVQFIRSEQNQAALRDKIQLVAKASPLKVDIMDFTALGVREIEKFNDIIEIEKYVSNQFNYDELSLTPSFNQAQVNAIAKKYNTDYFLWTGVISLREREKALGKLAACILLPYALPLVLPDVLTPDYDMLYYAILFDVTSGRRSIIKMDYYDERDSDTLLKAHIYDVFHQINKRSK